MADYQLEFIANVYSTEAAAIAAMHIKNVAFAQDTKRFIAMGAGPAAIYYWDSTELASQVSGHGAAFIGTKGITGITPTGGASGASATVEAMLAGLASGNANYIKNQTGQQASSNFNISGAGVIGTNLTVSGLSPGRIPVITTAGLFAQGDLYWNSTGIGMGDAASSPAYQLDVAKLYSHAANVVASRNTSNTSSSDAFFLAEVAGTAARNPAIIFSIAGTSAWSMGINNVAGGDPFTLSFSSSLGTSDALTFNSSLVATFTSNVNVGGTAAITGVATCAAGVLFGNASPTNLNYYAEGTFTITLTGCTVSVTGTATWTRVGRKVTLTVPPLSGTSNAATCTLTGLPAAITPTTAGQGFAIPEMMDNSTHYIGQAIVNNDGTIELDFKASATSVYGSSYTSSGTKGNNYSFTITYQIA